MDAASGSAAPVLRYFCSQTHCEEGKGDHEVTLKEYNSELAREEREMKRLDRMQAELDIDSGHYKERTVVWKQKHDELVEELKREEGNHELKLRELKAEVYKSKRPLKEMGEVMKREAANLERIFRKKELEIQRETVTLDLQHLRGSKDMVAQQELINEKKEDYFRKKVAEGKTSFQQLLLVVLKSREKSRKLVLQSEEQMRGFEERETLFSKEMDAINAELDSNDKDTATATTSAVDPGPVKTPTEQPEDLKATSSKKGTKEELSGKVNPATELARKERELERKKKAFDETVLHNEKYNAVCQQEIIKLEKALKREREFHELKLRELKSDLYTSKRTLKEMGEIVKRETANLERNSRRKMLEIQQELAMLKVLQQRRNEGIYAGEIDIVKESDRVEFAGDETVLQQQLLRLRADKEKYHKTLLKSREVLRDTEEWLLSLSKEMDAINAELDSNDKGSVTATTTTTVAGPGPVKTPAERHELLKATSSLKGLKEEPTANAAITLLGMKRRELKRKEDDLFADLDHFREHDADRDQRLKELQDELKRALQQELKRERENHELKPRELKAEQGKRPSKEMEEVMERETENHRRIFRRKELEIDHEEEMLKLLKSRGIERLSERQICHFKEHEVYIRERFAGDETELQQHLLDLRKDNEGAMKQLQLARESLRFYEDRRMLTSKKLDAINAALDSNDKGSATATASAADPGPVKTPAEQPEHLKAASSKRGTKEGQGGKVNPAAELARKESELKRNVKDLQAEFGRIAEKGVAFMQKRAALTRERENYDLKLCELIADRDKRENEGLSTEMVEFTMLESSKHQSEHHRELLLLDQRHFRESVSLNVRKIGLLEEYEFFYREKYAGDETALQQHLLRLREDKEKAQNELQRGRKFIRVNEESFKSMDELLDAINPQLRCYDEGSATATTSAADPGPVKTPTPTEHAPADTLLSTSVTDNPPSAPPSSSASPLSGCQKVTSPLEEKLKKQEEEEKEEEEERKEIEEDDEAQRKAMERQAKFQEYVLEKEADSKRKKDVIVSVIGKMEEVTEKLRDMDALAADGTTMRTDLTKEKKLVVDPIAATFVKYYKLKRSLTRDHNIKSCELDIEIAEFDTSTWGVMVTSLIRRIDNKLEKILTEGGTERDEKHVRGYQRNLDTLIDLISESSLRRETSEQRLQELVAEGEGDALVPAATKPPSHVPPLSSENKQATTAPLPDPMVDALFNELVDANEAFTDSATQMRDEHMTAQLVGVMLPGEIDELIDASLPTAPLNIGIALELRRILNRIRVREAPAAVTAAAAKNKGVIRKK